METPAPIVAAPVTPHVSRVRTNTIILDDCDPPHTVPLLPGDPLPEGTIEPGDGPPEGTIEPTDPPDGNSIQPTDPPDGVIAPNVIHVHGHVEQ